MTSFPRDPSVYRAKHPPLVEYLDNTRGTAGMLLFILTEAMLFVLLFFSYYFLARMEPRWPPGEAPSLRLSLPMLGVLLVSTAVLFWGDRRVRNGRTMSGRFALLCTFLLGLVFITLQIFEYRDRLKKLTPWENSYGSIFYTISGFHFAHLILGVLMLGYVLVLPRVERMGKPPHRAYHDTALYWYFVNAVWFLIVLLFYVVPNLRR